MSWYTKIYNAIYANGNYKTELLSFNEKSDNNLIIIPPEAGHNSKIVDYGPDQSLVECALKNFNGSVHALNKLPAKSRHSTYGIDDSIKDLNDSIKYINKPVHLVGLCQGGWQAAIYASLYPENVKSLTLAAAPINFHAGNAYISNLAKDMGIDFFKSLLDPFSRNMPGYNILYGFVMMHPFERLMSDAFGPPMMASQYNIEMFEAIFGNGDRQAAEKKWTQYKEKYNRFNSWYYETQMVPGKFYIDVVNDLFIQNKLIKNELVVSERTVELSNIDCPVYCIAANKDDITPSPQLYAIADHVKVPVTKIMVEAGHIGVFMGKNVIRDTWPTIFSNMRNEF